MIPKIYKLGFASIKMKKEEIAIVAQLLTGMKDSIEKLEEARRKKDLEGFDEAKRELINFQKQIDQII